LDWVRDESVSHDIRLNALRALARSNSTPELPQEWYRGAADDLRIAMLACEAGRLPAIYVSRNPPPFLQRYTRSGSVTVRQAAFDFLLSREELWAKQEVKTVLLGSGTPQLRAYILQRLPAGYFDANATLLKIAGNRTDPLRLNALRQLRGTSDSQAL